MHVIHLIEESLMKRTSLAVLMVALALVALAAPMAFAQAPAPKVTINGLIDNLTSYSQNVANYNGGVLNRHDSMWWGRTRGRFDIIGEVGKAKAVFGIELDHVYGQAGSNDSTIVSAGAAATTPVSTGFGTDGSFDLNTDSRGIIEVKWLYVEFPVPLIPIPTTARLGAQPFGAAASYKLAAYAAGDFPGVNIVSQITPNVKFVATYVQVEENLVGTGSKRGFTGAGIPSTQNRGDDFAYILSPEITPFKGLDIKPMFSMFYASGTTSGSARNGRGGLNTSTQYSALTGDSHGAINEYRYTVGVDARLRMGPFSLDPTVMYQFGNKAVIAPRTGDNATAVAAYTSNGAVPGRIYHPNLDAWLVDVRAGYQLGPLLIEALAMYTTGNSRRNNTLGTVRYYQPLDTDTGYLADWGTNLTSLGIDYLNAHNEAAGAVGYLGNVIGYDKYGRAQIGAKATYAITPELSVSAGGTALWTAQEVDRSGTPIAGIGIVPTFTGTPARDSSRYLGTEVNLLLSWRFAPGLVWDNQFGYLFTGPAWDGQTDPAFARNVNEPFMLTSRIRFTF
jgi:hypothetical protein